MWVYLYPSGTETELKNAYIGEYEFSIKYQEVEYIQSSWTQYINTEFVVNQDSRMVFELSDWTQNWSYTFFGADTGWATKWFCVVSKWAAFGNTYIENSSPRFWDGNKHTGELSQAWLYKDGTLMWTFSTQTFTGQALYIFWLNRSGSVQERVTGKLYSFELYDGATLVREMVPCYRIADTEIWLYDIVNDVFYTNQWWWAFTKWNDV